MRCGCGCAKQDRGGMQKACTFAAAKITELEQTIKIGLVNYLNTRPLVYGIRHAGAALNASLLPDYPANIAAALLEGRIDLGLVPVAVIPQLAEAHIVTDYCIGTEGEVASVCLFSDVPLQATETILLDYQSRTSVALLKILLQQFWQHQPRLEAGSAGFENQIQGTTAGLVIGDRALEQRSRSRYIYDLGAAWKNFTGLPFVFAAWVANKALPPDFIAQFNAANRYGIEHIPEVIAASDYTTFDLDAYYNRHISYTLDAAKREGLQLFLKMMQQ
jgi:chorismate dehydratase